MHRSKSLSLTTTNKTKKKHKKSKDFNPQLCEETGMGSNSDDKITIPHPVDVNEENWTKCQTNLMNMY